MRRVNSVAIMLLVSGVLPGWAGSVIFTDGFESNGLCSWGSEYASCGGGLELTVTLAGGVPLVLVYVPNGTYWMGSPPDEQGRSAYEDLHEVTLTQGYYVGKYEVTQRQWQAVMGTTPWTTDGCGSYGIGQSFPAYCVSWNEIAGAGGFVEVLNNYLAATSQVTGFRLPTEAEWERAARAGNQFRFSHGDVLECDDVCEPCATHSQYMWWCGDQPNGYRSQPVGSRLANAYGLFDMHGNEFEWVQDWWQDNLSTAPATNPPGPATGTNRVLRSADWNYWAQSCRSASRFYYSPEYGYYSVGFRLAKTAD